MSKLTVYRYPPTSLFSHFFSILQAPTSSQPSSDKELCLLNMSPFIRRGIRMASPILLPSLKSLEKLSSRLSSDSPETERAYWVLTQFCRYLQFRLKYRRDGDFWLTVFAPWAENMITLQIRLCEIVQRESFLLENDGIPGDEQEKRPERNDELHSLNRDYWRTERIIHKNNSLLPEGPLRRAYESLQEHPEWGLLGFLTEDCAKRGGCCGRACGCCEKPRSSIRAKNRGHCTKECGCCLKARGFPLDDEDEKLCRPSFDLACKKPDSYSTALFIAYTSAHP